MQENIPNQTKIEATKVQVPVNILGWVEVDMKSGEITRGWTDIIAENIWLEDGNGMVSVDDVERLGRDDATVAEQEKAREIVDAALGQGINPIGAVNNSATE